MKSMDRNLLPVLIPLFLVNIVTVALLIGKSTITGLVLLGLCIIAYVTVFFVVRIYQIKTQRLINRVFSENSMISLLLVNSVSIPCVLFDEKGRIIWGNDAMAELYMGKRITDILPQEDVFKPSTSFDAEVNGRSFYITNVPVERETVKNKIMFQYWTDRTEALHYSRLYEENLPVCALIYVDNFEDLSALKELKKNAVLNEVEKLISDFAQSVDGIYRRYENARFFVLFEAKQLKAVEESRFALLEEAKRIDTDGEQQVTLSIAIGLANSMSGSDEAARNAMELALGRGGDQAVVKRDGSYSFYGGSKFSSAKNSKVKARMFAKALRQLLENSQDVYIMGHRRSDMDCIGSALAVVRCAFTIGKKAHIVLRENNSTIENAVKTINSTPMYSGVIKTPEQAMELMSANSVMILVDTQRESMVEAPELLRRDNRLVVIDHHRRSVDSLSNSMLSLLASGSSSTSEMMAEVLQYFDERVRLTPFEAGAMLAGIGVDTKFFTFNTGVRTFEAASYLRKNGADTGAVKIMFQDNMEIFKARSRTVEKAELLPGGVAISSCDPSEQNQTLIAAQAADALITIRGITASFVISYIDGEYSVSARSLGTINVQLIMEKLGGGGHLTMAGAQLKAANLADATAMLKAAIDEFVKPGKK